MALANQLQPAANQTVLTSAAWYDEDRLRRKLPEALVCGVESLRKDALGQRLWMWPNPAEMELVEIAGSKSYTRYEIRVKRSTLRNVWLQTIEAAAALPFRQDANLVGLAETDEASMLVRYNLDGSGSTLTQALRQVFGGKLVRGIAYWWVDLVADSRGNMRSVARVVHPDDLLDFDDSFEDGRRRLKYLKMRVAVRNVDVSAITPDSAQGAVESCEERVVVYLAGELDAPAGSPEAYCRYAQWRQVASSDGKTTSTELAYDQSLPGDGAMWNYLVPVRGEFRDIPLVPDPTSFDEPYRGRPPFLDTAEEQASHWRKKSEKDELARKVATPLLHLSGVDSDGEGRPIGISFTNGVGWSKDPSGSATLIETSGAGLEALANDLRETEEAIRVGNLQPLANRPTGNITATEIGLHAFRAHSQLEAWAVASQAAATIVVEYMLRLMGREVPRELAVTLAVSASYAEMVRGLLKELYIAGKLSPESFFPLLKRTGDLPEEFDVDKEVAALRSSADFTEI